MKKILKLIALIICLCILTTGCKVYSKNKAARVIEKSLFQKYGMAFEVGELHTSNAAFYGNMLLGKAHEVDKPENIMDVEITKDYAHVYDNYMNEVIMREKFEKMMYEKVKEVWDGDVFIESLIDTGIVYPSETDFDMSWEAYCAKHLNIGVRLRLFVNINKADFDKAEQAQKVYNFADSLIGIGLKDSLSVVHFVEDTQYNEIATNFKRWVDLNEYKKEEIVINVTDVGIVDDLKDSTIEEIIDHYSY